MWDNQNFLCGTIRTLKFQKVRQSGITLNYIANIVIFIQYIYNKIRKDNGAHKIHK